jgi:hypothetical protein
MPTVVLALTLLATAAAGCSSGGGSSNSSSGQKSGDAAATAAPIKIPGKIGPLTKLLVNSKEFDSDDDIPKSVRKNLRSVSYADPPGDFAHAVTIRGGPELPIPAEGPPDVVQRLFSRWDVSAVAAKARKVSAGSVGGVAECAPASVTGLNLECGWVSGKMALVISFSGLAKDKAEALVPQILDAMVTP